MFPEIISQLWDFLEFSQSNVTRQKQESKKSRFPALFLIFFSFFQDKGVRAKRFFVYCYEVTPDFVKNFKYLKKDGNGEFCVDYMEAAFDQETKRGEFFVEFADPVYDNHLVDRFEAQGAKGAYAVTFQNNDGDKSAINALACVLTLQDKTGSKASRGASSLLADARKKQVEDAKQEELLSKEFSEKKAAAVQESLEKVNGNVKDVKDVVHSCEVKLESQSVEIVEMKQDVKSQGVVMNDIKNGFCNVIPDLQSKNTDLEKEVAHHITQRNIQEGKTAAQTRKVNEKDAEILALHKREEANLKKIEQLEKDSDVCRAVENLKEMLQLIREEQAFARAERADNARCAADNARCAEYLVSMIDQVEERAAKRPRV